MPHTVCLKCWYTSKLTQLCISVPDQLLYHETKGISKPFKCTSCKMTTSEWLLQFQGSLNRWVIWNSKTQIKIHQPPHNSIKLQRVTTDTCQQVYL